jgi:hypothetical protein
MSDDDEGTRVAALDTAFSIGMLALQRDSLTEAVTYFSLCARAAATFDDQHANRLTQAATAHAAIARERLNESRAVAQP